MAVRRLIPGLVALLFASARAATTLQWAECNSTLIPDTKGFPSDCATLQVPFDYTTPNASETIPLMLLRIKAVKQPSKGSILLNFGGPGLSAIGPLSTQPLELHALSGGHYDLITFDPRGVGITLPFTCYKSPAAIQEFLSESGKLPDESEAALSQTWSRAGLDGAACARDGGPMGSHMSTAFVARDLISIVDALGEDGMLRFWGFSYGTTLGQTVAKMFPDRIDKMVIDGVANAHEYYYGTANFEEWIDSDEVFSSIFSECIAAGPELCPLAALNLTAEALEAAAWRYAEAVRTQPIPINGTLVIDWTRVRAFFGEATYGISNWPTFTGLLLLMLTNKTDTPDFIAAWGEREKAALISGASSVQSLYGVSCSDRHTRVATLDEWVPTFEALTNISRVAGSPNSINSQVCVRWPIEPKERYSGDFNFAVTNPVLIASNRLDAHTPLKSAQNVSATWPGSSILVADGYGHCTQRNPSACLIRHTAAYWANHTLPPSGTVCEVDQKPYTTTNTWAEVIARVYGPDFGPSTTGGNGSTSPGGGNSTGSGGGGGATVPISGGYRLAASGVSASLFALAALGLLSYGTL